MDLPNFRRGIELTSTELNKLSSAIRSCAVTSVVGGSVTRTPGGTTLVINDQVRGGSEGSSGLPCPFLVSDASDTVGLKVRIEWGLIWQMLPTGMFANNTPPLIMEVTNSSFVYSKIVFDTNTLLPTSVSFVIEAAIQTNTSTAQFNLIASLTVKSEGDTKSITAIYNVCQQPFPSPCALS